MRGNNLALLQLSASLRALTLDGKDCVDAIISWWKCKERKLEVERAQQLAPEWAATHESD